MERLSSDEGGILKSKLSKDIKRLIMSKKIRNEQR